MTGEGGAVHTAQDDWTSDVLLLAGGIATVRPATAADGALLRDLIDPVPLRTREMLHLNVGGVPNDHVVDLVRRGGIALVGLVDDRVVALARYSPSGQVAGVAEVAVVVDYAHQAEGLGAILLEHLADQARQQNIITFVATVLVENTTMLGLLKASGFTTRSRTAHGTTEVLLDLAEREQLWDAIHRRDVAAQRASLRPVLAPRSVAVVGSARPDSVAGNIHHALLAGGYTGIIHRVQRHDRVTDLPEPVDLVVVAVPADHVLTVARDAAAAGAKGVVVVAAGFAEAGPAGQQLQQQLLTLCRSAGMRLVGPNCLGIVNTDPALHLNATFCDAQPCRGSVALVSQSGAVGIAALRHAERRGAGLSLFVSTGNKADVSGNDLLAYLEGDPRTTAVALYLESFGNARKFVRVAAAVGRTKPIVVVKAGRSEAGARAGRSHTAAAATPDAATGALLREAGVIRVDDLPELFDVLTLLQASPLPAGPRLAIIGNSGGPGVLAADACSGAGIQVGELTRATRDGLRALLPAGASVDNPVDLLATVRPWEFEQAVELVLHDPGVDAVLAIYTPLTRDAEQPIAAALARLRAGGSGVPLVAAFPGVASAPAALQAPAGGAVVPFFEFPEPAVRALGKVAAYTRWRSAPPPFAEPKPLTGARAAALALIGEVPSGATAARWLPPGVATAMLAAYGIPTALVVDAADADAAVAAASLVGYPVALKAAGPSIVHKSDVGGVALHLRAATQVRAAFDGMRSHLGPEMTSAVVQHMHQEGAGVELIAGLTVDPSVGPLILVGAGGTLTELLADRALRMPPSSRAAAMDQLASLRCAPRLRGYRGDPPLAIDAAADVLLRLADIAADLPEVLELDLNPLMVTASGVCALDVRIRVGPPLSLPYRPTRTLTRPPDLRAHQPPPRTGRRYPCGEGAA